MNEINEMYQDLIIDHSRAPKNFGVLAQKSHHARGHNALCGDIIDLDVLVHDEVIVDVAFNGDGCAISKASASLMTERIKNKTTDEALALFSSFHGMLTNDDPRETSLGKLEVFQGVKQFPIRVKCATLCWHTLNAALQKQAHMVTTE